MSDEHDPERLRRNFARSFFDPGLLRGGGDDRPDTSGRRERGGRRTKGGSDFQPLDPTPRDPPLAGGVEPKHRVIIEVDSAWVGGLEAARQQILALLGRAGALDGVGERRGGPRYVFVDLTEGQIRRIASWWSPGEPWPILSMSRDELLYPLLDRSVRTVKADACMTLFGADGAGMVVAVADSGVDGSHPHFATHDTLRGLPAGVEHRDFSGGGDPLADGFGHGTHVAGVVAGLTEAATTPAAKVVDVRSPDGNVRSVVVDLPAGTVLKGVAPRAKVLSLKVLNDEGKGYASQLIEALEHVHDLNDGGRRLRVHCVNLSLGYPFDAEWFAAGHSPLCQVVNRLSRSGVVVVAAAGNDGSVLQQTEGRSNRQRVGVDQSINDPGNADEAITVGATHAESPHIYGVSYFSSRGPTVDGRVKPDLVAPGERILSCAAAGSAKFRKALASAQVELRPGVAYFREESGTSMAAPHVAGAAAALMSVRQEFVGRPERIKAILVGSCTDLKRKADFQGAGLLDMLRAMQSI